MLDKIPEVGDIIWGEDNYYTDYSKRRMFFQVLKSDYFNKTILLNVKRLSDNAKFYSLSFHLDQMNWGFVKHKRKTICEHCK